MGENDIQNINDVFDRGETISAGINKIVIVNLCIFNHIFFFFSYEAHINFSACKSGTNVLTQMGNGMYHNYFLLNC